MVSSSVARCTTLRDEVGETQTRCIVTSAVRAQGVCVGLCTLTSLCNHCA